MLSNSNEIKVLVLCLFDALDEEMEKSLADGVVASTDLVNMFEYEGLLEELSELGLLKKRLENQTPYYTITETGREVVHEADQIYLLRYEREDALKLALRYYDAMKTGIRYSCELKQTGVGFTVNYRVTMQGKPILEASAYFDNRESAETALQNCENRPRVVSNNLMAVLTGDADFLDL